MEGATHFIEQYNNKDKYKIYNQKNEYHSIVRPIKELDETLLNTKQFISFKTIAVWYIKPLVKSKLTP